MTDERRTIRCAIYTRKSTDEGLDQDFNSLDAQHEACSAYIASQKQEGWKQLSGRYDDGGHSGGSLDRPALKRLLEDMAAGRIDMIVVYKIDRLTRSLMDFSKLVERMDRCSCSFVSVTQAFNTSTSMGRLMLNVLLSFAQFEREVTAERIRDKIAASKKKGMWMGGIPPLGYRAENRQLVVDEDEALIVRQVFDLYQQHRCITQVKLAAERIGLCGRPIRSTGTDETPGKPFSRGGVHWLLTNPIYVGEIRHRSKCYPGLHPPIIERAVWDEVQELLQADPSGRKRNGKSIASPSLLAGKIVDETGDRLTPSHAKKAGRRFRYYVSRRLVDRTKTGGGSAGWRLPAEQLEASVAQLVNDYLKHELAAIREERDRAESLAHQDDRAAILDLAHEVRIAPGQIEIALDPASLARAFKLSPADTELVQLTISSPFQTRRRGVESRLVLGESPAFVDAALLRYVARALAWWDAICGGESLTCIAARERLSPRLIANHLPAAFLAPDILERIVQGRQPNELTVGILRRSKLPMDWTEQRRMLGFSNAG